MEKADIATEADVQRLVNTFYGRVQADALLGPVFNDIAQVDWERHLPIMYDFWSAILLDTHRYKGQPFTKHLPLPIDGEHFARWIELFQANVDEHFAGPVAEAAKAKAQQFRLVFQSKLEFLRKTA